MNFVSLPTRDELMKLLDHFKYPVVIIDTSSLPIWANKKFFDIHEMRSSRSEKLREILLVNNLKSGEYVLQKNANNCFYKVERSSIKLQDETLVMLSFFNVSKPQKQQIELLAKMKVFEQLSEYLPEGIVLFDLNIIYSNPSFEKLVGYSGRELSTKKFEDLIHESQRGDYCDNIQKLHTRDKSQVQSEVRLMGKNGHSFWTRIKTNLLIDGDKQFFSNVITDISRERAQIEELNRIAFFDALTGIYNRRKFNELLTHEYNRAKRYSRSLCGVFFDIDHFKKINDTYGHDIGDEVLQGLAHQVQAHIRDTDCFARWGGEEFILLLPETVPEQAVIMAEHIRNAIASHEFSKVGEITISLGVTMLNGKERQSTFLKRLDKALYQAKEEGRNRLVIL